MLARLLALARASVKLAEAEVAVGDEGAHAELDSHHGGLSVTQDSGLNMGRITAPPDVREHAERHYLVPALAPASREIECFRGAPKGVVDLADSRYPSPSHVVA